MSIKSDRWIRRMAEGHGMIEPFEPGQVRTTADGERIVSYGTSSYGYDIRCAPEFKVFTNLFSTVVDPKRFDEKSFVDIHADVCVIPPNSFALARTVEYFRIPRNVLTICLGKSTYARCFRADTRVALVDGTSATLEEMARGADAGQLYWGYGLGAHGRIEVVLLDVPRFVGRDALLEIELDDGSHIHATPDHEFVLRDGRMAPAASLRPGQSLMPLYRELFRGYESVYQPLNGHQSATHRLADAWNLRAGLYEDTPGTHRHHVDHDRRNNRPDNLARVEASEHLQLHNAIAYGEGFDGAAHGASIRDALQRRSLDPAWRVRFGASQAERARDFWHEPRYGAIRERLLEARRNPTDATREKHRAATIARYTDPAEREQQAALSRAAWARDDGDRRSAQAAHAASLRLRSGIDATAVRTALDATGSIRGAARLLECDRSVFRRFPDVVAAFAGRRAHPVRNHKVVAVRELPGDHDVYCLTVPETGNFALEAGVFVSNCGIIVNVTPFEPEWEGYVTLEFSNTTPLPAKIYAGEGCAQVIFFESDEVCETSYKDRGGKYQGQRGVTLPKT